MTKKDFQKELLEKVKPGVKASDLKKLKRSKSDSDIPKAPPLPVTNNSDPPNALLQEQLTIKQQEIENLRKQKEDSASQIKSLQENLEKKETQILELRLENIQDFGKYRESLKVIEQELNENVEQASEELTTTGDKVSSLRTKLFTATQ